MIHWLLLALSFRVKIFYPIQTSIHVGMSTLKKTTKMGQWYIFAATQQQTQTNICWDKTCMWVMEFKITTLPLLNWHHTHRQKNRQKIVPIISSALNACMHTKQLYVSRAVSYFNEPEFEYRTRTIITRGLYTFYPLFEVHLCTVTFGLMYG